MLPDLTCFFKAHRPYGDLKIRSMCFKRIALQQGRHKKRCMVGGKHRWVVAEDRDNSFVTSEFFVQKSSDVLPMPTRRMLKTAIKKHVSCVQGHRIQRIYLWTKGRQVEYGQV